MSYSTRNDVLAALKAGAVTLEQASQLLESLEQQPKGGRLYAKVSAKGAISVYGLQRMPVTLYASQWERLLSPEGRAVLEPMFSLSPEAKAAAQAAAQAKAAARETAQPAPSATPAPSPKPAWLAKLPAPKAPAQAYIDLTEVGGYIGPFPNTAAAGEYAQSIPDEYGARVVSALPDGAELADILPPTVALQELGITAA